MGLEQVSVAVSHPHFFVIGDGSEEHIPEEEPPAPNPFLSFGPSVEEAGSVVILKNLKPLGPGEAVSLPVWIRAANTGRTNFRFLFYYRPQVSSHFVGARTASC